MASCKTGSVPTFYLTTLSTVLQDHSKNGRRKPQWYCLRSFVWGDNQTEFWEVMATCCRYCHYNRKYCRLPQVHPFSNSSTGNWIGLWMHKVSYAAVGSKTETKNAQNLLLMQRPCFNLYTMMGKYSSVSRCVDLHKISFVVLCGAVSIIQPDIFKSGKSYARLHVPLETELISSPKDNRGALCWFRILMLWS